MHLPTRQDGVGNRDKVYLKENLQYKERLKSYIINLISCTCHQQSHISMNHSDPARGLIVGNLKVLQSFYRLSEY